MNKYPRRKSTRLKEYNYSQPGFYYVTICTDNRQELFGLVENEQMKLNKFGKIVDAVWLQIPNHFNNIQLDKYVIMPNHIHGIIKIVGARLPRPESSRPDNNNNNDKIIERGNRAPTGLGQIIAYFKYISTKQINEFKDNGVNKIWQRNFYDHIIRNEKSLNAIREYILNNPINWGRDIDNLNSD